MGDRNEQKAGIRQGIILAGGRSLRMGTDKAMLDIGGKPLLLRIIGQMLDAGIRSIALAVRDSGQEERYLAALGESGDEWPARIIPKGGGPGFQTSGGGLRNSSGQLPSGSGTGNPEACISFAQDSYPDSGPLAGLHASLSGVPEEGYVFVMACDMPVLSIPLFRRLAELAVHTGEPGPDIIRTSGQPFHALYHTRTASVIQQQLERGDLRVMHLLERLQSVRIGTTEEEEEAFVNLNTPASYEHYIMGQRNPSSDSTE